MGSIAQHQVPGKGDESFASSGAEDGIPTAERVFPQHLLYGAVGFVHGVAEWRIVAHVEAGVKCCIERLVCFTGTHPAVKIQCDKVETVQNDLNGTAVPADRVARLSEQWRKTESNSSIAPARHKLAKSIEFDSCLRSISDAKAVGDSMLNVLEKDCDWVAVDAAISALPALSIGAGFTVYWDQLGYSAGKLLTIIGFQPEPKYNSVKIEAIG